VRPTGTHQRWLREHRRSPAGRRTLRTLALTVVLFVLVGNAAGAAAASPNPTAVGSVSNATSLSGAGYVAVSGNYAYVAPFYSGTLTVVDISNPTGPQVVGQTPFSNALLSASHITIAGSYAYVTAQNRNGPNGTNSNDDGTGNSLVIVDISTPTAPTIVGTLHNSNAMFGPHGVAVSGNYAYIAAQGCLAKQPCPNPNVGDGFDVVDVSNPANPTIVASIQNSSLPAPWTGTGALKHACSVTVSRNYAYVTASYTNRLTIIDISNPLQPAIVASLQDATNLPLPVDVAVTNGYAYVANQSSPNGVVTVVDVHNPPSPQVVGTVASPLMSGAYRIRVRSNFAYVAAVSASATDVIDISDPAHPRLAAPYQSTSLLWHTVGVDLDPTGQYAISTSGWLSTELNGGNRPLYPPYPGQPGGQTATGTVSVIALDPTTPIGVSIGSNPGSTTSATTALFSFSTNDAVSTVRCSLDGGQFTLCNGLPTAMTQSYGPLAAGPHTFTVEAIDAADHVATASYSWTITASTVIDPTTPVLDNFNRANGGAGSKWSVIRSGYFAPMNVSSNTAVDSSSSIYAWNYWNAATYGPDVEAYATVANYTGTDAIRIGARVTPGTGYSGYFVSVTGAGAWSIIRVDNGVVVNPPLASGVTQTLASGDKIGIRVAGSVVTALHYTPTAGWTQVLSANDTRYTSAGRIALEFRAGAMDDFGGGTIVAPANTGLPSVSGTASVGQQLQANTGTWMGTPTPNLTYQWQDCDSSGENCTPITAATAGTYTVQASDGGHTLGVVVTGTNSAGSSQAVSAPTAVVPQAPANTQPPQISGTVAVGQQVQASTGTWTGTPTPTFTYQWQDCDASANCTPITGATSASYTIQSSDVGFGLAVVVTGSNSSGSSQVASATTIVVPQPPQAPTNTVLPSISGTTGVGQQLQANPGSWTGTPAPTFTYQWLDCDGGGNNCNLILGATASSYTVKSSDAGFALEVVVTGSNSAGSSQAVSAPTSLVLQAPINTQPPQVTGTAAVGQQLQATSGTWTGAPTPTFSYQWEDCDSGGNNCVAIQGATATSYTIQSGDVGFTLEVLVTGSNSVGSSQAASAPTAVVTQQPQAPVNTQVPSVSGTVAVGQQVQASPGGWTGNPAPTFSYQWQDCDSGGNNCTPIQGATGSSYTIQSSDVGSTLEVVVTGSNSAGSSQATSAPTSMVLQAPANSQVPQISGTVSVGQQLQATAGTWTGTPAPTFTYQWQDCNSGGTTCNPIAGATSSSYTIQSSDGG
jgi:hypothetical protein